MPPYTELESYRERAAEKVGSSYNLLSTLQKLMIDSCYTYGYTTDKAARSVLEIMPVQVETIQ